MEFGVSEYTLVFRRVLGQTTADHETAGRRWAIVRPVAARTPTPSSAQHAVREVAEVYIVPYCSTLALDDLSYERFLRQSGVLDDALELLSSMTFAESDSADTIRKEIQSLVMEAEVQFIVDGMTA